MPRVLIVDDKQENLYYLSTVLTGGGFAVDTACHGAEALVKGRQLPPDLVVSDLLMPVMDGYTLLRHWKADPRLKQIPFIVYTATYTEPEDERLALDLGADAFILKPAEPDEFLEQVSAVLARGIVGIARAEAAPSADDAELLEHYSETLIRKLEEKTLQLEDANRALKQDIAARKAAESALRKMAETQEAILNSLPAHIALVDAEGVIVSVNDAWRKFATANILAGPDFGVGQNYLEVCDGAIGACSEEAAAAADGIRRVLRLEMPEFVLEYPCHSPTELRWFRLMATPLDVTRPVGAVVMHMNITDRKKHEIALKLAEKSARESEQRLEFVLAASNIGDWDVDLGTGAIQRSLRHDQCFGYSKPVADWDYGTFLRHIHPGDCPRVDDCFRRAMAGEGDFDEEFRTIWPDGTEHWLWIKGSFHVDESGVPHRIAGIVADVTPRKRSEAELRMRDRAIQAVSQGIVIADACQPDTPIVYASPSFERLTGYSVESVLGRNCRLLQGPETDPSTVGELHAAIEAGRECSVEILNYRQDQTPFWCGLVITPVRDNQGRVVQFVGVQQDVTERRRLEEQLRQAQKMEAVGRLAGGVAHDFNNMLAVICGWSEMLLPRVGADESLFTGLAEISKAGERATGLTRQLLAFSRQQILEPKLLDLRTIVADMEKMLRRLIGEDIDLLVISAPDLGTVRADPGQIQQCLLNLAVNARDAMPNGGRITLMVRNAELGATDLRQFLDLSPGPYVELAVSDSGARDAG